MKEAAREAAPPGVQSALIELGKPENQQTIDRVADAPGVRRLAGVAGQGAGQGVADYLLGVLTGDGAGPAQAASSSPASRATAATTGPTGGNARARMAASVADLRAGLPAVLADVRAAMTSILNDVRGGAVVTARDAAKAAADGALAEPTPQRVRDLAAAAAGAGIREIAKGTREDLGPGVAAAIKDQVGPAVAAALREQVGPAVGQLARDQIGPAVRQMAREAAGGAVDGVLEQRRADRGTLAEAARQVAKGGALGARDAVVEAGIPAPTEPLQDMSKTLDRFIWLSTGLLAVAGVLALGLLLGLAVLTYAVWKGRLAAGPNGRRLA